MAAQKQLPSFASIISVLSIAFYCLGFLRIELELNEQRKRINALENVAETAPSNDPDVIKLIENSPGSQSYKLHRKRRQAYSTRNATHDKHKADTVLKINKLLSEGGLQLCQSKKDTCSSGLPGPPGPPGQRGQKGSRGPRGQKGRKGNKGDNGIMGSPGKSGRKGITGPVGPPGISGPKGQKGDTGPTGMPGAKGEAGESISAPSASNILGQAQALVRLVINETNPITGVEMKTLLVAVTPPRFTVKPPAKHVAPLGGTLTLNCSATGDLQPVISWKKQGGQLPVGRSQQINGALVIRSLQLNDSGSYICVATIAGVLKREAVSNTKVQQGGLGASNILGRLNRKYLDKLNSFLRPVLRSSSQSSFLKCWHAKTDGWAASTFHSYCDGKGPTVTIIKVNNYIFGGYTDVPWSSPKPSSCCYASSSKSFIFSLYNTNGYAPVKRLIMSGRKRYAIYRCSSYGPTFGGRHDIYVSNNAACNGRSYTNCGDTYPLPRGYSLFGDDSCTFYAGSYWFTPTDIEVFYETTT